jgi:hypothetical protein
VFEQLRQSLNDLLDRATKPEDRREIVARMKTTLVQARMGLDDVRDAMTRTQRLLEQQRKELLTVKRRKEMAAAIPDAETVAVAERFEKQLEEKVAMLEQKFAVQTQEVALAEREVDEMKAEIRRAMAGAPASTANMPLDDPLDSDPAMDTSGTKVKEEIDSLARQRARVDRDDEATRRLEELKKRMGK